MDSMYDSMAKPGGFFLFSLVFAGCSSSTGGLAPGQEGASGSAGAGGNTTSAAGANSGGSSAENGGSGSGSQSVTEVEEVEDPTQTIPGVVTVVDAPPPGCQGEFGGGRLRLRLDASIPLADLEARSGQLFANDFECTTAEGAPLSVSAIRSLEVVGSAADEAVVLDFSSGDWNGLLTGERTIELSLGEGDNSVVVTGTDESETYYHGSLGNAVVLDITGDEVINLVAEGATVLGLDLRGGDDTVKELLVRLTAALGEDEELPEELAELTPLSVSLAAFGGEGNDSIDGGSGNDQLGGGPGDDVLNGLEGTDQFSGSVVVDGSDILNGGPDFDLVTYSQRSVDLVLNLCVAPALTGCNAGECSCEPSGAVGEQDLLVNIESARAGYGNDRVNGTDAAESLMGGPGDDELYGLAGSDVLLGGRGFDLLSGGEDEDICDPEPDETPVDCEL